MNLIDKNGIIQNSSGSYCTGASYPIIYNKTNNNLEFIDCNSQGCNIQCKVLPNDTYTINIDNNNNLTIKNNGSQLYLGYTNPSVFSIALPTINFTDDVNSAGKFKYIDNFLTDSSGKYALSSNLSDFIYNVDGNFVGIGYALANINFECYNGSFS